MSTTIIVTVCEASPAANFKVPSLSTLSTVIISCTSGALMEVTVGW